MTKLLFETSTSSEEGGGPQSTTLRGRLKAKAARGACKLRFARPLPLTFSSYNGGRGTVALLLLSQLYSSLPQAAY